MRRGGGCESASAATMGCFTRRGVGADTFFSDSECGKIKTGNILCMSIDLFPIGQSGFYDMGAPSKLA